MLSLRRLLKHDSTRTAPVSQADVVAKDGDDAVDHPGLSLLLESIAEVSSTIDIERLLVNIVDKSIELTSAERGILLLHRDGESELTVRVARNHEGEDLPESPRYSTRVVNKVVAEGKSVSTVVESDAQARDFSQSLHNLRLRAVMCTALTVGERSLGVIYVDSQTYRREFTQTDLALFEALSRQIGIALTNAHLVQESLEKTRLEQSLRIAGQIQSGLLPKGSPQIPSVDLHGWYHPYEMASGDYYDFVELGNGRIAVVVGDVSGHGIGAALITATARATLRAYLQALPDLGDVVGRLNRDLEADLHDNMFMTLFVAVIDSAEGTLEYVNAGHPPPLLLHEDGSWEELGATGLALGILSSEDYLTSEWMTLQAGDLLFAFTDGIPEATGKAGELFGERRLRQVLKQLRHLPSCEIVADVARLVEEYQGGAVTDDRTAVAMKYVPPQRVIHRARDTMS